MSSVHVSHQIADSSHFSQFNLFKKDNFDLLLVPKSCVLCMGIPNAERTAHMSHCHDERVFSFNCCPRVLKGQLVGSDLLQDFSLAR